MALELLPLEYIDIKIYQNACLSNMPSLRESLLSTWTLFAGKFALLNLSIENRFALSDARGFSGEGSLFFNVRDGLFLVFSMKRIFPVRVLNPFLYYLPVICANGRN